MNAVAVLMSSQVSTVDVSTPSASSGPHSRRSRLRHRRTEQWPFTQQREREHDVRGRPTPALLEALDKKSDIQLIGLVGQDEVAEAPPNSMIVSKATDPVTAIRPIAGAG